MKKKTNKSFGLQIRGLSAIVLGVLLAPSAGAVEEAYAYTLTVGKNTNDNTGRTLAAPDFTTITAALNKIPNVYSNGACSARYLVKVLPGVYNERVTMKPCVDIEGSGELASKITTPGGSYYNAASATVVGASEAELRFLTVENTGGNYHAMAIYSNRAAPRLTHITAIASGGSNTGGVVNRYASSIMTNVTAIISGNCHYCYGVDNTFSSPVMTNITATASGSAGYNYGVRNGGSSPRMMNVTATASGGHDSYGVSNGMSDNTSSSPVMTNVIATASDALSINIGVYNQKSSLTMENVTATASGGSASYGVYNSGDAESVASAKIHRSTLRGTTASLYNMYGGTARVGASLLDGPVDNSGGGYAGGPAICVASYSANFEPLNANCQ